MKGSCHICFNPANLTCLTCGQPVCDEDFDDKKEKCNVCITAEGPYSKSWLDMRDSERDASKDDYEARWTAIHYSVESKRERFLLRFGETLLELFVMMKQNFQPNEVCLKAVEILNHISSLKRETHTRYVHHFLLSAVDGIQGLENFLIEEIKTRYQLNHRQVMDMWHKAKRAFTRAKQ